MCMYAYRRWLQVLILASAALLPAAAAPAGEGAPLTRIGFGSCCRQDRPQPIWDAIVEQKPDLFILLGDNVYGDTQDMTVLRGKYDLLAANAGFVKLRSTCPLLAIWDDHDYGANDAGAEYPMRVDSQALFLDFFQVPADSPRRGHEGIYDAATFGPEGRRVQVILLDTRYFRSGLTRGEAGPPADGRPGPYVPSEDAAATLLGDAQWDWLKEQLARPAELRILASSIQFLSNEHRFEKWGNLPRERARMLNLLASTKAEGVVFLSGDRHHAEISRLEVRDGAAYPLYDITSSALNQSTRWNNEINELRVGCVYREPNFGLIRIEWDAAEPQVIFQIHAEDGTLVIQHAVPLKDLRPRSAAKV